MQNPISGNDPGLPNPSTAVVDAAIADIYAARDMLHLVKRVLEQPPLSGNDAAGRNYAVEIAMQNIDIGLARLHGEPLV